MKIDQALNGLLNGFEESVADIRFSNFYNLLDKDAVSQHSYPGIYLIEVNTGGTTAQTLAQWIRAFEQEWTAEAYRDKFVQNRKKRRIQAQIAQESTDWMPSTL